MGDFRALVKIEFEMAGKKEIGEFWINWFPEHDGVDKRITDWLARVGQAGVDKIRDDIDAQEGEG